MFRAIIYQRSNLNGLQVADIGIVSASIKEDKTQKATSKIVCKEVPSVVSLNDVIMVYNNRGIFVYWGVIKGISDKTLTCSQFESLWNDDEMIVAQTSTNQKAFFNNSTVSNVVKFYLGAKSSGYASIANSMSSAYVPTFSGLLDKDVADNFKGLTYNVTDSVTDYMPYPKELDKVNLESFLYDVYNTYNRIIRPHFTGTYTPSVLPSGYTEMEYIESSGTQYIDTGVAPNGDNLNKLKIQFDGQYTHTPSEGEFLFGTGYYNATGSNRRTILCGFNSSTPDSFVFLSGAKIGEAIEKGTFNTSRHTFAIDQVNGKYILDSSQTSFSTTVNSNLSKTVVLFAFRHSATSGAPVDCMASAKCYGAKIWSDGTLIRNFVPARRNSDSVYGLYDTENDVFYTNDGTGSFTAEEKVTRYITVECFYPTGTVNNWDYNSKSLFDSWECISNLNVTKEEEETNTVYVYSDDGSTFRGARTVKNDGTIVSITSGVNVTNRLGSNKTTFVYDSDNSVSSLAKAELPSLLYNHKITFSISFSGEYDFDDFNLGMPIKFYVTEDNHLYDSCLSAWEYSISENSDTIKSAKFTLGKVRKSLTSKLNRK